MNFLYEENVGGALGMKVGAPSCVCVPGHLPWMVKWQRHPDLSMGGPLCNCVGLDQCLSHVSIIGEQAELSWRKLWKRRISFLPGHVELPLLL
jgi:hypothetical protein